MLCNKKKNCYLSCSSFNYFFLVKVTEHFLQCCHINRSLTLDKVFFVPKCPEVGSLWHDARIQISHPNQ